MILPQRIFSKIHYEKIQTRINASDINGDFLASSGNAAVS